MASAVLYAPGTGAGTAGFPYDITILQLSWQARAEVILSGVTCFDSSSGAAWDATVDPFPERIDTLNSVERLVEVPSGIVVRVALSDRMAATIAQYVHVPIVVDGTLGDLATRATSERTAIVARLAAAYPDRPWQDDPTGAAIGVLDDLLYGDDESQRLWSYYRDIFTPTRSTPMDPAECYASSPAGQVADIARCQALIAAADDVAVPVRRAELCYGLVVWTEVAERLASEV